MRVQIQQLSGHGNVSMIWVAPAGTYNEAGVRKIG